MVLDVLNKFTQVLRQAIIYNKFTIIFSDNVVGKDIKELIEGILCVRKWEIKGRYL